MFAYADKRVNYSREHEPRKHTKKSVGQENGPESVDQRTADGGFEHRFGFRRQDRIGWVANSHSPRSGEKDGLRIRDIDTFLQADRCRKTVRSSRYDSRGQSDK